ncbi:GerMN domain-containing protein [Oceanobacillus profundus]|uniref:GerMN domain-containing protein n=1 Tax=Oceanobacillus TaxID=182709 RepID=UPI000BA6539A|nr:GerMN domain-containing protein [Oceanobacillus profundus]MCM3400261.1 GerMN domain-containing protein [Oceanobacillus profundus]MDO6448309.1 GerMN domain-containing protein [Oceanobacillus profundus]PAE30960.1 spore gernimation protein [Paenibacillus sp. 7884-2]
MHKRAKLLIGTISISVILSGCFQGEQSMEEMDPPPNAEAVDNLENISEEDVMNEENAEGEVDPEETVARQLFLIDANGMVAPQTIELPNTKQVATQVVEYLVKGGPVTEMLPNGFQAVLPEGTEVLGINLQEDGTMIVDVSEEFKAYEAADELKILESITHTLTQFENVSKVKLWINGHPQTEMPVNGTPIGEGYSRTNGINIADTDTLDLLESRAVTMYYPSEHGENRYYVPVTQHIEVTEENEYSSIVQALIDGPGYKTNVVHVFNPDTLLTNSPDLNDGILELVFSKDILQDSEQAVIADEVMETLVRTLTEQENVEAVDVKVEDVDQLVNENGEEYTEPVTKQAFTPTEKL